MISEKNILDYTLPRMSLDGIAIELLPFGSEYEIEIVYDIPAGESSIDKSIIEFEVCMTGKQYYGENPRNLAENILMKMAYSLRVGSDPESLETIGHNEVPLKNMDDGLFRVDFGNYDNKEYGPGDLFKRVLSIGSEKIGTLKIDMDPGSIGDVSFRLPTEESYVLLPKKNITSKLRHRCLFKHPEEFGEHFCGEVIIEKSKKVPYL